MTGIVEPCFGKNFNDLALCSEGSISKPHMDRSSRLCRDSLFLANFLAKPSSSGSFPIPLLNESQEFVGYLSIIMCKKILTHANNENPRVGFTDLLPILFYYILYPILFCRNTEEDLHHICNLFNILEQLKQQLIEFGSKA